jgi:DNA-binding response OmpR family regulator
MKIFIVEDEEKLAKSLQKGLEKEGYVVDYVVDGERGESKITMNREEYDLVILDLMLPSKGGFEICKSVREKGVTVPILILTARGGIEDKVTALDSGADDYLTKPFSFEELLARVRALLRRPEHALPPRLEIKHIVMDRATRTVFVDGKEIPLTLREFALLEYLMRNPNQVLDREKILSHVWDSSGDYFSNVVDVYIKNLRAKIETKNHAPILETIRGIGYRIKG